MEKLTRRLERTDKPVLRFDSLVPQAWMPELQQPKERGLVYVGALWTEAGHYRNWAESFAKLHELGVPVTAFSADNQYDETEYQTARVFPPQPLLKVLQWSARFEAALVGSPVVCAAIEEAMPNKLYEALAAGLPIIALNATEMATFVEAQ